MTTFYKPLNSVLIKPAGPDCNMACTYCFYLEKCRYFGQEKHRMEEVVLEEMVKQVMNAAGQHVSFGWQGGEPALMGLPFFEKAVEFQQKYGRNQSVGNGLQTNGILLDKKWAAFLHKYNFLAGLSIDGPEHVHNRYRILRSGEGSWRKVHEKINLLLDADVEVNAISVLNNYSVQFPEEIYTWHKENGLTFMQFIPCIEPDPAQKSGMAEFSVDAEQFGRFLCTVFDLWMRDFKNGEPTTSIRYFDSLFHYYVGFPAPECTLLHECGIYVVIEHNGDIYSCDFFVEDDWKLGNVMCDSISDCLNSERQFAFGKVKSDIPVICEECRWLKYCWGGCPKDRQNNTIHTNENPLCAGYRMFFEHADERMKHLAEEWKKKQAILQMLRQNPGGIQRNDPCPCGSGKKFKSCCEKYVK